MFRKKSLHQKHAAAHAVGLNALSLFHTLAGDLERAADEHGAVADAAHAQITELSELRLSADQAADRAVRQADAIRKLVG